MLVIHYMTVYFITNWFALYMKNNEINIYKNDGLLKDYDIELGSWTMGIGHVRYPTSGELNSNLSEFELLVFNDNYIQ